MKVQLVHLGRACFFKPAVYGPMFHDLCTVDRVITEPPSPNNRWRVRRVPSPVTMYWYAEDAGEKAFCTYSGYAPMIKAKLIERGLEVIEECRVDDGLGKPDLTLLQGVEWRTRQKEAMARVLSLLSQPISNGGVLVCPTAFGKTFLMKKLAQAYPKSQIVITVSSKDIAKAIYSDLSSELFKEVGMIGAGKNENRRISVVVSKSLHKAPKEANLILADECHSLLTEQYVKVFNRFRRARMLGFTATPTGKSDNSDGFMEAIFGPILYDVDYQTAVSGGNVVQLNARMVRVNHGPDISHIEDKVRADREGLWRNDSRNSVIADTVKKVEQEVGPDAQILIMVDKIEHAYVLGQLLPDYVVVSGVVEPDRAMAMMNSGALLPHQQLCTDELRDKYRIAFEKNILKRAIATKIWKQGVDFRDLAVLVRADGTASAIDSGQVPGRLSRLGRETDKTHGLLIDFMDHFDRRMLSRSMARLRVYKENGWNITHVDPAP